MANTAKNAILRAKLAGVITDIMPKTVTDNVYVNDTTTLTAYLETFVTKASIEQLEATVQALGELANKDKVSQTDLDSALTELINGKATYMQLDAEITRSTNEDTRIAATAGEALNIARTASSALDTLRGSDTGKSVRTIANEELAAQLIGEGAKENLDTLKEIADWIQAHPDDASAMNTAIEALQAKVALGVDNEGTEYTTVKAYVEAAIAALQIGDYAKAADLTALAGRVTSLEGRATEHTSMISAIQTSLGALSYKNEVTESDLDAALKEKVNAASEGNHSHNNKDLLDTYDQVNEDIKAAVEQSHIHDNADVLDAITADVVAGWNTKATIYYSSEQPANLAEGDLWVQFVD
jgi:hypothetical protein